MRYGHQSWRQDRQPRGTSEDFEGSQYKPEESGARFQAAGQGKLSWQEKVERRHARKLEKGARQRARKSGVHVEKVDRSAIIARDESTCYLCGKLVPAFLIHLDHVIPLALGGPHTADNLKVACARCNISKGARLFPAE